MVHAPELEHDRTKRAVDAIANKLALMFTQQKNNSSDHFGNISYSLINNYNQSINSSEPSKISKFIENMGINVTDMIMQEHSSQNRSDDPFGGEVLQRYLTSLRNSVNVSAVHEVMNSAVLKEAKAVVSTTPAMQDYLRHSIKNYMIVGELQLLC